MNHPATPGHSLSENQTEREHEAEVLSTEPPLQPGHPWPLGAHWDGKGVNFALFSANAERVELYLDEGESQRMLSLPRCTDQVWHGYLPDGAPGLSYAYRVHGPSSPGNRFEPQQLLVDPYTRELTGTFSYHGDNHASHGLRARVVDSAFDWGNDAPPPHAMARFGVL